MSVSDVLTSRNVVRMVFMAGLVMVLTALAAYTTLRLRAVARVERQIGEIQAEMTEIGTKLQALDRDITIRLSVLERVLYGQGPEEPQVFDLPAPTIELWQKNRDRELRDRLQRLERWRLDHFQH